MDLDLSLIMITNLIISAVVYGFLSYNIEINQVYLCFATCLDVLQFPEKGTTSKCDRLVKYITIVAIGSKEDYLFFGEASSRFPISGHYQTLESLFCFESVVKVYIQISICPHNRH